MTSRILLFLLVCSPLMSLSLTAGNLHSEPIAEGEKLPDQHLRCEESAKSPEKDGNPLHRRQPLSQKDKLFIPD
jgi:hypothetical protein